MDLPSIIHLGSRDHERWSIQREVLAVTEAEVSQKEARQRRFAGCNVVAWCPAFWHELPADCRRGSRTVCFFHHTEHWVLREREVVAGLCINRSMLRELQALCPDKPVYLAPIGGVESARPFAERRHPTEKIRLLVAGAASAQLSPDERRAWPAGASPFRKSPELLLPIAERLDPARYAFVLVGRDWQLTAAALRDRGWTVIEPGPLEDPAHFRFFGEGDLFLMLSRLEGGPLPLLETMGLGLWPICTPTGVAPELIRHGENGFLVSAYDGCSVDGIADEVASLIEALDGSTLKAAAPRIQESVAHRTWPNFRQVIERALREVFG